MTKAYSRFLTALFCLFLGGLMVWQVLLPDRERSDVDGAAHRQDGVPRSLPLRRYSDLEGGYTG